MSAAGNKPPETARDMSTPRCSAYMAAGIRVPSPIAAQVEFGSIVRLVPQHDNSADNSTDAVCFTQSVLRSALRVMALVPISTIVQASNSAALLWLRHARKDH